MAPELRGRSSERQALDRLLADAREGRSAVLVLRGPAGIGKTSLLRYVAREAAAFRVVQVAGIESEMELPYAGLHQLCAPVLDALGTLPEPQQDALKIALGLVSGAAPDRFLVGLATLTLLAAVAEDQPLLCVVDDLQWLDGASAQALAFVARRVLAERVAIVFSAREPSEERHTVGLPELQVRGLGHEDARALLAKAIPGRLDARVRERIIAEAHGNPLALLELPQSMSAEELAGGFGGPGTVTRADLEAGFRRRLDTLPADTRRFLQLASADPVGEPLLVWRAAEQLGLDPQAAAPAVDEGLFELGAQLRFRHPCMRSAAYRSAGPADRQAFHAALAAATDPEVDPDRRAWHRAQATPGTDEAVACELERSAERALGRGGLAAAAAFLDRAARLTPEAARRTDRLLCAARAKRDAGALEAALELLVAVDAGPMDARQAAEIEQLRGEIALDQRRAGEAARLLTSAARRLDPIDAQAARITHFKALGAAMWAGEEALAHAAQAVPPAPEDPNAVDLLLDAFALRVTRGYRTAEPRLRRALDAVLALEPASDVERWLWLTGTRGAAIAAMELWDDAAWHTLSEHGVQVAREMGALVRLQFALHSLARTRLLDGDLAGAARSIEEERALASATGTTAVAYTEMTLTAWRGQEALTAELIARERHEADERGIGRVAHLATYAEALLNNGIGRYDAACAAARRAFAHDHLGYAPFVLPEVAEAAARSGDEALLADAVAWMADRTPSESEWARGIGARVRAFAAEGDAAEALYRESIERLGRSRARLELARSRLLYGEWLRRENRRVDAREQLRVARESLLGMGAEGFAERARHELLATGEKVRKRSDDTRDELTAQEQHIARLAAEGRTNPEIGAELFLSPRTVEWHLKKVFTKLGISSRRALRDALPRDRETTLV